MILIFEGTIAASKVIKNLPDTGIINILTSSDLTVEFWLGNEDGQWAPAEACVAPGAPFAVPSNQCRLTGTNAVVKVTHQPAGI
jgi:hypothetical protein